MAPRFPGMAPHRLFWVFFSIFWLIFLKKEIAGLRRAYLPTRHLPFSNFQIFLCGFAHSFFKKHSALRLEFLEIFQFFHVDWFAASEALKVGSKSSLKLYIFGTFC
jgi:hypothetical protein